MILLFIFTYIYKLSCRNFKGFSNLLYIFIYVEIFIMCYLYILWFFHVIIFLRFYSLHVHIIMPRQLRRTVCKYTFVMFRFGYYLCVYYIHIRTYAADVFQVKLKHEQRSFSWKFVLPRAP